MKISLHDLLPVYFTEARKQSSEIWGKHLEFESGELIKIVAPSGSGKTSLMHFLYGLRSDYNGVINYAGQPIKNYTAEDFALQRRDNISIVLQDMRLLPEQTVLQNLEIKRQLNPYHPKEKITEMAEQLGIGSKLRSLAKTCSYGEQQRVAIIRALVQPFHFLLLDEPFSHLDNNNAGLALTLMLEEAKARGAAIIFADLEKIEAFPYTRLFHL